MVNENTYLNVPFARKDSRKAKRDTIFKANRWWGRLAISKLRGVLGKG